MKTYDYNSFCMSGQIPVVYYWQTYEVIKELRPFRIISSYNYVKDIKTSNHLNNLVIECENAVFK
jgi:hypothetical protein